MQSDMNKIILTDVDGVLLNWIPAFHVFMKKLGFKYNPAFSSSYDMSLQYDMEYEEIKPFIEAFNQSATMGFLAPLRDSVHYVQKLHREHGYTFHVITSMSDNEYAQELRRMNLKRLFGETVFAKFVFLPCGADKDVALKEYENTSLLWVEDKVKNVKLGLELGLDAVMMVHDSNTRVPINAPKFQNWKEIYEYVT